MNILRKDILIILSIVALAVAFVGVDSIAANSSTNSSSNTSFNSTSNASSSDS